MKSFLYTGYDQSGAKVSGEHMSLTIEVARKELIRNKILIKTLKEASATSSGLEGLFEPKVDLNDIEFLTSELAVLLDSGLKIDKGLELLRKSNKKKAVGQLISSISDKLKSGKQLSEALAETEGVFDPLYVNLVSIGEATGTLPAIFRQLAEDLAFRRDLQQKISQAMTYPMVILAVCLASVFFIFNYVVPNMSGLFEGQPDLPWYTAMLLGMSDWLINYQWLLVGAVIAFIVTIRYAASHPAYKQTLQRLMVKLPLIKSAVILIERIRFNSGLAMMLNSGVSIDVALQLSSGNIKNTHIRREIEIAIGKVKQGVLLSTCLRQSVLFPDFFASLLHVGEESGQLNRIFDEIASRSQREFTQWVTRFTSLLEPLLIVVMGGLVGGVVVIMMLSITTVTDVGL